MAYILGLFVVAVVAWGFGVWSAKVGIPAWLAGVVSAICAAAFMYCISASQADAVPVDVEAFKQPVKYRECRPLTWDDVQAGKDVLPLPPDCVMKPPAQRAEVSKHEAKPAVNPFAQFARY